MSVRWDGRRSDGQTLIRAASPTRTRHGRNSTTRHNETGLCGGRKSKRTAKPAKSRRRQEGRANRDGAMGGAHGRRPIGWRPMDLDPPSKFPRISRFSVRIPTCSTPRLSPQSRSASSSVFLTLTPRTRIVVRFIRHELRHLRRCSVVAISSISHLVRDRFVT